jgi:protein-S-isoprenylcysteine O-methyltransferase Ste14
VTSPGPLAKRGANFKPSPRLAAQFAVVALCFVTAEPAPASLLIGAGVSLVGELMRLWAAGYGYKLGALSGRGPYRFVRHPYFLGSTLLFLGLTVAGRDPYVAAGALLLLTVVYRQDMRADESQMARQLGPDYAVYRDQVPAFLPQLIPFEPGPPRPREQASPDHFSFRYAVLTGKHRELDALLLTALAFGLLGLAAQLRDLRLFHGLSAAMVGLYLALRFIYYAFYKKTGRRS